MVWAKRYFTVSTALMFSSGFFRQEGCNNGNHVRRSFKVSSFMEAVWDAFTFAPHIPKVRKVDF
jgi:hypothetical protein